jgi:hypothetical protein
VTCRVEPEDPHQEPTVRSPGWGFAHVLYAGGNGINMPLLRYFMYVGGALLTLLLISNAVLPRVPLPDALTSASDLPPVRIHSERKLPERVVFDTSVPAGASTPIVKTVVAAVPAPAPLIAPPAVAEMSAKARVREAFAQLPNGGEATDAKVSRMALVALPEPRVVSKVQVQKRKIAKPRTVNPSIMVAQQPHFGPFSW